MSVRSTSRSALIADVKKALPLAKAIVKQLDADKDRVLGDDELKRLGVRDNFVTRNLVSKALRNATYPDHEGALSRVNAALDQALRSVQRADQDGDGKITGAQMARVSQLGRALVEFAALHKNHRVSDFSIKPFEKPGSAAWVKLAEHEYFNKDSPANFPFFGSALILGRHELPSAVQRRYDAFRNRFPDGKLEACSWLVNGEKVYYFHVKQASVYQVQICDKKGKALADGVARAGETSRAQWSVRWREL